MEVIFEPHKNHCNSKNDSASQYGNNKRIENTEFNMSFTELQNSVSQTFEDELDRLLADQKRIKASLKEISVEEKRRNVENKVLEIRRDSESLKLNNKIRRMQMERLRTDIRDLAFSTDEGILVWRIDNFKQVLYDAEQQTIKSLYSPIFYTSKCGYKMRIRLYPNGDAKAWGKFCSVYLVLMKGAYDDLLKWPFEQKVTIIVLDQKFDECLIDAFEPRKNSSSFQKPKSEMNLGAGSNQCIPLKFILDESKGFLNDGNLYLKFIVDCCSLKRMPV